MKEQMKGIKFDWIIGKWKDKKDERTNETNYLIELLVNEKMNERIMKGRIKKDDWINECSRTGGSSLQITPIVPSQNLPNQTSIVSSPSPPGLPHLAASAPNPGSSSASHSQPEVKKPEVGTERQDVAQILASLSGFMSDKSWSI